MLDAATGQRNSGNGSGDGSGLNQALNVRVRTAGLPRDATGSTPLVSSLLQAALAGSDPMVSVLDTSCLWPGALTADLRCSFMRRVANREFQIRLDSY